MTAMEILGAALEVAKGLIGMKTKADLDKEKEKQQLADAVKGVTLPPPPKGN
jgi:hypothetical protein